MRNAEKLSTQNTVAKQKLVALDEKLFEIQQKNTKLLHTAQEAQAGLLGGDEMQKAILQQRSLIAQVNQLESTKAAIGKALATSEGLTQQIQVFNGLTSLVKGSPSRDLNKLVAFISKSQGSALTKIGQMMEYVEAYNVGSKLAKHLPIAKQISYLTDAVTGPFGAFGNGILDVASNTAGAIMELPAMAIQVTGDYLGDSISYITPSFIKDSFGYLTHKANSFTQWIEKKIGDISQGIGQSVIDLKEAYTLSRIPYPIKSLLIADQFEHSISGLKKRISNVIEILKL